MPSTLLPTKEPFKKYVRSERGVGTQESERKNVQGGGLFKESTYAYAIVTKYLPSILNKRNCTLNIIHVRFHSRLFLHKYVVTFRGIRYVSNVASFELTEINSI